MEQKVFLVFFVNLKCRLQIPERRGGGGVVKLPPGFYGNAEADYSDASFKVNSCSVTIKPLTVPCFVLFCFFFLWDFRGRQQSLRGLGHWEGRIIIRRYDRDGWVVKWVVARCRTFTTTTRILPASFPVVLGDFGCDVTFQACRENSPIALGSKPPLVTRIARTGLGTRLESFSLLFSWAN